MGRSVALHFALRLRNGIFVDSVDWKRLFKFRLEIRRCIRGVDCLFVGVRKGSERHVIVPAEHGYDDQNVANTPPDSTLYFDIV